MVWVGKKLIHYHISFWLSKCLSSKLEAQQKRTNGEAMLPVPTEFGMTASVWICTDYEEKTLSGRISHQIKSYCGSIRVFHLGRLACHILQEECFLFQLGKYPSLNWLFVFLNVHILNLMYGINPPNLL